MSIPPQNQKGSVPFMVKELARSNQQQTVVPGWRRAFKVFTYFATFATGVIVLLNIPEKDPRGRDHVLSKFYRWRVGVWNDFLGVDKLEKELRQKKQNENQVDANASGSNKN